VRKELEARLERERRHHLEGQIAEALTEGVDAEVPQAMVEHELDRRLEDQMRVLAMRGVDPRTAPIDWRATRERMRDGALRKVRFELLLEAIAEAEGIQASDADVEERLQRIAESSGKSVDYVRSKLAKDHRLGELRAGTRLEKVVDFLIDSARMERRAPK
jgi:trigger factor